MMDALLATGKDCPDDTVSPECVDWSTAKRLTVMDMLDAANVKPEPPMEDVPA